MARVVAPQTFSLRRWLRRGGWLLGLAVVFLGLEIFSAGRVQLPPDRLYVEHPYRFWALKPGLSWDGFIGKCVHINSWSLRADEPPPTRPALTVLLLGDSCTYCVGVEDGETIDAHLQRRLQDLLQCDVRVYNGGCSGYSSYQGLDLLAEIGPVLKPDVVVIAYMFGDSYHDIVEDKDRLGGPIAGRVRKLLWKSHFYLWLRSCLRGEDPDPYQALYRGPGGFHRVSVGDYETNLRALAKLARQGGARVMFLRLPQRVANLPPKPKDTRNPFAENPQPQRGSISGTYLVPHDKSCHEGVLLTVGAEEGIVMNAQNLWTLRRKDRDTLFWDDIHFNAKGCRAFADDLTQFLLENKLVVPPPSQRNEKSPS